MCFYGVWECLVQVDTLHTHSQIREKGTVMQVCCSLCYLKIGQCLMLKKVVSKCSVTLHTPQPHAQCNQTGWWFSKLSENLVSHFWVFAQLPGSEEAETLRGDPELRRHLGGGRGLGMAEAKLSMISTWSMLKAFTCNLLTKRFRMTS